VEFVNRDMKCSDCGLMFVFSAGEQSFFTDKGFTNDPKHCKSCKALRGKEQGERSKHRSNARNVA